MPAFAKATARSLRQGRPFR